MSGPVGYSNASAYHEERTTVVATHLRRELALLRKRSTTFRSLSTLASHVAVVVGRSANDLRRNPAYRRLLEDYLASQPGATTLVSGRDAPAQVLLARIRCLELQLSTLRSDRQRLENPISSSIFAGPREAADDSDNHVPEASYQMKFECTARALQLLLERSAGFYAVDEERTLIVDEAAKTSERCVVSSNYARPYVEWLNAKRNNTER